MPDREDQQTLIDKRKRGWFWDYNDLFDSSLSEHAIIVRLFLARCANKNQEAWPSLNTIARRCKISKPTAIKAVRELESQGWIRRTVRKTNDEYDSTIYYLEDPPQAAETHGDDEVSAPPGAAGGGKASLPGSKAALPPGKNEDRGVVKPVDHLVKPVDPNNTHITIPIEKEKDQDKEDAAASASVPEPGQGRPAKAPESTAGGGSDAGLVPGRPPGAIMKGVRKDGAAPTNCRVDRPVSPGGEIARLEELRRQQGFYDDLGEAPGDFPCDI